MAQLFPSVWLPPQKHKARPTGKEALLERWRKIKVRQTPQPSPISSDDKESIDNNASNNDNDDEVSLEHGVAHQVLVFGDEFNTEDSDGESDTDDA
jgi:hypothetical protein